MIDTRSYEYVKWMSEVWRLNDERNKRIGAKKKRMQLLDDIAEASANEDVYCG
jgi:hypothetical protein